MANILYNKFINQTKALLGRNCLQSYFKIRFVVNILEDMNGKVMALPPNFLDNIRIKL